MNNQISKHIALIIYNYKHYQNDLTKYEKYIDYFDIYYITNKNIVSDKINIINKDFESKFDSNDLLNDHMVAKYYKTQSYKNNKFKHYKYICWIEEYQINFDLIFDSIFNLIINQNQNQTDIYLSKSKNQNLLNLYVDNCTNALYKNKLLRDQIKSYAKVPNFILYDSDIIIYKNSNSIHNFMDNYWNEIKKYGLMCNLSLSFNVIKFKLKVCLFDLFDLFDLIQNTNTNKSLYVKNDLIIKKDINKYINFINGILWINLDRCLDRKVHMDNLLSDINIINHRVSAIDGNIFDMQNKIKNMTLTRNFSSVEKACTLSHIKAINNAQKLCGDYFMICEDDIKIVNIYLLNINLEKVILEAPKFDILIISKTFYNKLSNQYTKWNANIQGTVCYIISRSGIEKICSIVKYDDTLDTFIFNIGFPFEVADLFIYNYINTYVYKYNLVSSLDEDSTIHSNHLSNHKYSSQIQLNNILDDIFN
jgi:GR25 family glycosyltransferase involved in LPS biosynthesis